MDYFLQKSYLHLAITVCHYPYFGTLNLQNLALPLRTGFILCHRIDFYMHTDTIS